MFKQSNAIAIIYDKAPSTLLINYSSKIIELFLIPTKLLFEDISICIEIKSYEFSLKFINSYSSVLKKGSKIKEIKLL